MLKSVIRNSGIGLNMVELSKTVRLKISKWYAMNLLVIEKGFNAHFEKWNEEGNECDMTLTCFDDYPHPSFRKTKEDLESYLIRKFGSMIVEDKRRSRLFSLTQASKGIPLKHPIVKKDKKDYPSFSDNYASEYILELTKQQLMEANSTLQKDERIKADRIKPTSSYDSDIYQVCIGEWTADTKNVRNINKH